MENLNEGKKKRPNYMAELAEIDKQSAIVAMEAKIDKLAEMIEAKTTRLSMVSEDENLSELIDKQRVKEMQKEIKILEKEKSKMEKMYEKMGAKKKEVVKEEDPVDEGHMGMYDEDDDVKEEIEEGNVDYDSGPKSFLKRKPNNWLTEKEENIKEEELDEAHCSEEDDSDSMKEEEVNEEVERFRKLAGLG